MGIILEHAQSQRKESILIADTEESWKDLQLFHPFLHSRSGLVVTFQRRI